MDERLKLVLLDWRFMAVMHHLKRANVDYGKSIMKDTGIPLPEVISILDRLEEAGIVERIDKPVLKNTYAKFKRKHEVRKHHVYYALSRSGELMLRQVEKDLPGLYAELIEGNNALAAAWARFTQGSPTEEDAAQLARMGLASGRSLNELGMRVRDRLGNRPRGGNPKP